MGINCSQFPGCNNKCDCGNLDSLPLDENIKDDNINERTKKTNKQKKFFETKNSFQITKENSNIGQFFSNQIIAYINNKSDSKNENNISIHNNNNPNTCRNTNAQTNSKFNNNNSIYFSINKDNNNNINDNSNNNCKNYKSNNNISINSIKFKNNVTVEKKNEDYSSLYDDNKDSFKKMENKSEEDVKKFEKGSLNQISKIEEKKEKTLENGKEKYQSNINLDNANIEDLMNIIEKKNIENEGTIIDYNGEKCTFKGELNDKKKINGKGKILFKDGRIYEGNFVEGKLNGEGKYIDSNGDIYEGIFRDGNLSGKGTIIKIKEKRNKSILSNNSKNSLNKEENISNSIDKNNYKITYIGEIKDFKKEGQGTEICSEYKYEGNFKNDKKNGYGVLTYLKSKDKYEGEFKDNKITGYGYYIWENGHSFKGDFVDGKMNGKGLYKWPDGIEYEGEYKDNIREGIGRFKWKNGVIFEGNFIKGKPDGKGKMIYEFESIDAEYRNGSFVGDFKNTIKNLKLSVISKSKNE